MWFRLAKLNGSVYELTVHVVLACYTAMYVSAITAVHVVSALFRIYEAGQQHQRTKWFLHNAQFDNAGMTLILYFFSFLIQFETVEMARACKKAVHGIRFPLGNPKKLEVEYVALADLAALRVDDAPPSARQSVRYAPDDRVSGVVCIAERS